MPTNRPGYMKEYRKRHPERMREYRRRYYQKHREELAEKKRRQRLGLPTIDPKNWIIQEYFLE